MAIFGLQAGRGFAKSGSESSGGVSISHLSSLTLNFPHDLVVAGGEAFGSKVLYFLGKGVFRKSSSAP